MEKAIIILFWSFNYPGSMGSPFLIGTGCLLKIVFFSQFTATHPCTLETYSSSLKIWAYLSFLLAGHFLNDQKQLSTGEGKIAKFWKTQYLMNALYIRLTTIWLLLLQSEIPQDVKKWVRWDWSLIYCDHDDKSGKSEYTKKIKFICLMSRSSTMKSMTGWAL